MWKVLFFPRPSCKARGRGQGATILRVHHQVHHQVHQDTSKNLRGFVDKNEARVAPCSGLLYSGYAYSSTDVLDTICWQHLCQMERKAKPIIAKKWNYNPNHLSLAIITNECCTPCGQSPPKKRRRPNQLLRTLSQKPKNKAMPNLLLLRQKSNP